MSDFRPVEIGGLAAPKIMPEESPAPVLQWIEIELLLIDDSYQRPLTDQSRKNVERIAQKFDWAHFAPVIVAPADDGFYAIIDGQCRAHAALLVGKKSVPCCVMICARKRQAGAFSAINAVVTRMQPTHLHRAAVAAGDAAALEIEGLCREAGVSILRSPTTVDRMARGQTQCIAALHGALKRFGRPLLVRALSVLAQGSADYKGMIYGGMIDGLCLALKTRPKLTGPALIAAFDQISLYKIEDAARAIRLEHNTAFSIAVCEEVSRGLIAVLARAA